MSYIGILRYPRLHLAYGILHREIDTHVSSNVAGDDDQDVIEMPPLSTKPIKFGTFLVTSQVRKIKTTKNNIRLSI